MAVATLALVLTMFAGPVHAQTGYGDDTVPPRSLTADGTGQTASSASTTKKQGSTAVFWIGGVAFLAILIGSAWYIIGKRGDESTPTT
jgi:hypothetical protein